MTREDGREEPLGDFHEEGTKGEGQGDRFCRFCLFHSFLPLSQARCLAPQEGGDQGGGALVRIEW